MVKDFQVGNNEEIGFYISLLMSSFSIAQFISAIPWGIASDTFGRKPIIMVGQLSSIIGMLLFGLSKTYIFAIVVKTMAGLMNGNISIFKTMISEITINNRPEQRAQAFSVLQIIFGIGSFAGVALSAIFLNPVKRYPFLFEHSELLKSFLLEYPYFLPCFMASFISFIGFILGLVYLKESLVTENKLTDQNETTPLLFKRQQPESTTSYSTVETDKNTSTMLSFIFNKLKLALTPAVLLICFTYGLVALETVYYDELFVIWAPSDKKFGGLEMSSSMIGITLMFGSVTTILTQVFLFHRLIKHFGSIRLFQLGLIGSILVFFSQSFTGFFFYIPITENSSSDLTIDNIVWTWITVGMIIKSFCQTILFTSVVMLISEVAPYSDTLATIYGFSQCCSSSVRAFGPLLCGTIWTL
ncbi:major facilitator superfamily domain-containing protein [Cunninghamella echinulata]|nr:major facilitator superfamily domain-containing protein [Cunninghamella echinulata]